MLQGSKLVLVVLGLGVGVAVADEVGVAIGLGVGIGAVDWLGVGVGVGVGVTFGAADLTATPLFQTNFPFFLIQVKVLFASVTLAFIFLHVAPGVILGAENAAIGVNATDKSRSVNTKRETLDKSFPAWCRIV